MGVLHTVQRVIFVGVNFREKPEMAFRNNFRDSNIRAWRPERASMRNGDMGYETKWLLLTQIGNHAMIMAILRLSLPWNFINACEQEFCS